ncbi:MAG: metallophosphoesterase [Coriobacteriia bacterium]|nr:metallophosphoesterase [Coriobacteriia bacterium]MBN2823408.1 metallophosphoesterase [Coriobacteriia bacterium]
MNSEKPIVIAHISDLHCGSQYHIPSVATRVVDEINELQPDALIVTGDLTDMGFRQEYLAAQRLISRMEVERVMVLPGNHDARNVGDMHFEELFGARSSELRFDGVRVLGLDSSEPDLDSGRIGRERYRWIEERFSEPEEFKVVALHHHLIPVPGTGRERNIVYDAGDALRVLSASGCDLVLCGHKHVPNVWRLESTVIVNAGTACSYRLRGKTRASYNVVELHSDRVKVILKHPFDEPETVADFSRVIKRECVWQPDPADSPAPGPDSNGACE